MNELLKLIMEKNLNNESKTYEPFVINKNEVNVFKEVSARLEENSNNENILSVLVNNVSTEACKRKNKEDDNEEKVDKSNIEDKEIIKDEVKQEKENETENKVEEYNDNIEVEISENEALNQEQKEYIEDIAEVIVETLKYSLFKNYEKDIAFEVWFENIKDVVNEMKYYDLVPAKVKIRRDKLESLAKSLLDLSAMATESYNIYEDYIIDLRDAIAQEVDTKLADDLTFTISTNLLLPLLFIDTTQVKSEEQEILVEALKSNTINLLTVFTSRYLSKIAA